MCTTGGFSVPSSVSFTSVTDLHLPSHLAGVAPRELDETDRWKGAENVGHVEFTDSARASRRNMPVGWDETRSELRELLEDLKDG